MAIDYGSYIPSSMFGMSITYSVLTEDGAQMTLEEAILAKVKVKQVIIQTDEKVLYNRDYSVIIDGVKSMSGNIQEGPEILTYSSIYRPLYAEPPELRPILRGLMKYFSIREMYIALRNASQKAHQLQGMIIDPNNSRFKLIVERDTTYYPTQKYVVLEAALRLMNGLFMSITDQQSIEPEGSSSSSSGGDTVKLGDFEITPAKVTDTSTGSTEEMKGLLSLIGETLNTINTEHKFWQDAMMNRNKRGYTSPVTAKTRSTNGLTPADRGID